VATNTDLCVIVLGQQNAYVSELIKISRALKSLDIEFIQAEEVEELQKELLKKKGHDIVLVIDAPNDDLNLVVKWLWNGVRLKEGIIGRQLAGTPVIVVGSHERFLQSPEGIVFRKDPVHHQFLTRPIRLYTFLKRLRDLCPIDPSDLAVINRYAPGSVVSALGHSLRNASELRCGETNKEMEKQLHDKELDLANYELMQGNSSKILKAREAVAKLRNEVARRNLKNGE